MLSTLPTRLSRTVLLVEDVETCATLLEVAILRIPGVDVACAVSGQDALHMLDEAGNCVCALVTDLNMARGDGFELIAHVRSDQRYAGLPIIVVSGDTDPGTPARVSSLGANAYFAKPYSPMCVRRTLEELLDAKDTHGRL